MVKITEKALLDGYDGITRDGTYTSKIRGSIVFWNYRTGPTGDGFNCVTSRAKAAEITLEYDRVATISMHDKWNNHASIAKIKSDEQRLWGDEI